jgi:predicted Zn-dependent protease with MMP-like domain
MIDWSRTTAPSLEDLLILAQRAFNELPAKVREAAGEAAIQVQDLASDETLDALDIDDPFALTGLYEGVNRLQRSVSDPTPHLARIVLYRRAILDEWAAAETVELGDMVSHVLIHEIGHHLGFSDEDIDALLDEAD